MGRQDRIGFVLPEGTAKGAKAVLREVTVPASRRTDQPHHAVAALMPRSATAARRDLIGAMSSAGSP